MKTSDRILATAVTLALSGAGFGLALADTKAPAPTPTAAATAAPAADAATTAGDKDEGPVQLTEVYSGGPSPKQGQRMSEDGLRAVHDMQVARVALNDGYTDDAKKLLKEAQLLLDKVKKTDRPVTVETELKVGDKDVKKDKTTVTPDLIPILSELQIVEDYAAETPAKREAVNKAREHLHKGERKEAIETLKLAEVGLVSHEASMPLGATTAAVDEALKLIDSGKLHEANLELKKASDALVENTTILSALPTPAAAGKAPAGDGKAKAPPAN